MHFFGNSSVGLFGWYGGSPSSPIYVPWNPPFQNHTFQIYDLKPQFDDIDIGDDGLTDRQRFAKAKWMDIGGIIFQTNASEFQAAFRAVGSTTIPTPDWYQEQSLSWEIGGGQRMIAYDTIPLIDGCVEAAFTMKNYPDNGQVPGIGSANSVGWNLKIKKFGF